MSSAPRLANGETTHDLSKTKSAICSTIARIAR